VSQSRNQRDFFISSSLFVLLELNRFIVSYVLASNSSSVSLLEYYAQVFVMMVKMY
jgi:hypothetical protein